MFSRAALLSLFALTGPVFAQSTEPLSAIDWLSDSVAEPVRPTEPGVAESAGVADVSVAPILRPHSAGIGLISPDAAGIPADLWGASPGDALARHLAQLPDDMLPAMQALLKQILIARLVPPADTRDDQATSDLYFARIDRLLAMGALDEGRSLLIAADTDKAPVFRRWFDVALLLGEENTACRVMRTNPDFFPTYPARIFCLARNGDWDVAALTLGTAEALGILSEDEDILLAGFLDPELFDTQTVPPPPVRLTPLDFRLYEAVGERLPTTRLPLAFARADLSRDNGWKIRLTAAERLAASGALSSGELFSLYRERDPSASGGIWERVEAVQALDRALASGTGIDPALRQAWAEFAARGLEVPLAREYGGRLASASTSTEAVRLRHLSGATGGFEGMSPEEAFREALLSGTVGQPHDEVSEAIAQGFAASGAPTRLSGLLRDERRGEALFRAFTLMAEGVDGDHDAIADAIATLRLLGFEATARQAAIELLILDRRG